MEPHADTILSELQQKDGILWRRILGQNLGLFDEVAFWVLLEDETQLTEALTFLRKELRIYEDNQSAKITLSFKCYKDDQDIFLAMLEGEDVFTKDVQEVGKFPVTAPRTENIFDTTYPDDPWALRPRS